MRSENINTSVHQAFVLDSKSKYSMNVTPIQYTSKGFEVVEDNTSFFLIDSTRLAEEGTVHVRVDNVFRCIGDDIPETKKKLNNIISKFCRPISWLPRVKAIDVTCTDENTLYDNKYYLPLDIENGTHTIRVMSVPKGKDPIIKIVA